VSKQVCWALRVSNISLLFASNFLFGWGDFGLRLGRFWVEALLLHGSGLDRKFFDDCILRAYVIL